MTDKDNKQDGTVVDQLADSQAQVAALTGALEAAQAQIAEQTARADKAESGMAATTADCDAKLKAAADALATTEGALAATREEAQRSRDELGIARRALAMPSFAQAARQALAIGTPEGTPPAPAAGDEIETKEQALAAYGKLTDAREKAEFRNKHKGLLGIK